MIKITLVILAALALFIIGIIMYGDQQAAERKIEQGKASTALQEYCTTNAIAPDCAVYAQNESSKLSINGAKLAIRCTSNQPGRDFTACMDLADDLR